MYRQSLGPAFPGEPTDAETITAVKKAIMRGDVPSLPPDLAVPLGRAIVRREGADVTVVAWGRAVWTAMRAAEALAKEGIELEIVDLRTLVPPDMETVSASIERTGRLLVAAEDRAFAGFARQIQGDAVERFPGLPARALGQKYVPGIAQSLVLEEATVLTWEDIHRAAREIIEVRGGVAASRTVEVAPRYFLV
jgi:2-oxoisovalerate dehydrogenase E1 component